VKSCATLTKQYRCHSFRGFIGFSLLICFGLLFLCCTAKAQTVNWNGFWVGSWSKLSFVDKSGCNNTTAGLMLLQLAASPGAGTIAGGGTSTGHLCTDGCEITAYAEAVDGVSGSISGKTMKITLTADRINGPCAGDITTFSITGTNTGNVITGTMTDIGDGSYGPLFLENYTPIPNTISNLKHESSGMIDMIFSGMVGSNYVLQVSTNLTGWSSVLNFTCTNTPMIVSDSVETNLPKEFCRIVLASGGN
jgi:hypothetical protein